QAAAARRGAAHGGLRAVAAGRGVAVKAVPDLAAGQGVPERGLARAFGARRGAHDPCSFPEAILSDATSRHAWWRAGPAHASVSRPARAGATGTRCKATSFRSFSRSVWRAAASCFEASSIAVKMDGAGAPT